jgi:hypothetical protein
MPDGDQNLALPTTLPRRTHVATWFVALVALALMVFGGRANAEPSDPPAPPLPVFQPAASNWTPKFPFPFDATRKDVTPADITAEGEMCQWFNAQYAQLVRQIDQFGFNLVHATGNYGVDRIQEQADAVTANIDQTVAFLTSRTQSLTQTQDFTGDVYFPLYQGESFYRLWQHLSNVGIGIRAHNPAWVYGPSVQRVKHWGSRIERSHVCD